MTPELKIACEVIFQEHKSATEPFKWHRDAFRGRVSLGLSEMAREILVKKNIILVPNKAKKVFTQLNPDLARATTFEEAELMVVGKIPLLQSEPVLTEQSTPPPVFSAPTTSLQSFVSETVFEEKSKVKSSPGHSAPTTSLHTFVDEPVLKEKMILAGPHIDSAAAILGEEKWYEKRIYLYFIWPVCGALAGVLVSFLMNFVYTELFGVVR